MKKKYLIYFSILLMFSIFFKFFENGYIILKNNYDARLIKNYGYCEKSSYGFIKYIYDKYNFKNNINIINDEEFPSSELFFYKPQKKYDDSLLILLNYNNFNSKINIKDYLIIDKYKNCFFLKKND